MLHFNVANVFGVANNVFQTFIPLTCCYTQSQQHRSTADFTIQNNHLSLRMLHHDSATPLSGLYEIFAQSCIPFHGQ